MTGKKNEKEEDVSGHGALNPESRDGSLAVKEAELLRVTLSSIGDGVITTDSSGKVTFLNPVAQSLTGWTQELAVGRSLESVFHIVNQQTRAKVENPALRAIRDGLIVGLANHTVLIAKDGSEKLIDDSAAPIRNERGEIGGAILVFRDITARKAAADQLRDAHEFTETIRLNMGEGLYTVDAVGRVTSMNPAAERLFGWTFEEMRGRKMHDVTHFKHRDGSPFPAEQCAGHAVLRGGKTLSNVEDVFIRKDGTFFDVSYSSSPLRKDDAVTGLVVVFRDVTDLKETERALQQSEARKSAMFETALDCIITIDHKGRVIEFNTAAERTFGFARQDVVGRELAELIIPEELRAQHRRGLAHYLATGVGPVLGRRVEMPALRADGSELLVELAITCIESGGGPPVFTAYLRDITQRARAERAQRLLAAIVDSSADAIISKDLNGVISSWNNGAEMLFGYTAREAIGRPVTMLIPPDRMEEEARILSRINSGETVRPYETVRMRKDGSSVYVSLTVSPVRDAAGEIVGASKVARDITEKHFSEIRYRRLFQAAQDGILILDPATGRVTDANPHAENLLGLVSRDIIGRELHEVGLLKDEAESKQMLRNLRETGSVRHEHVVLEKRRGEVVDLEFVTHLYEEGSALVAQCSIRDITERVKMQRKLAEHAESLASESRRKDEFLAMLSHELRNPIAPIGAAVHLMRVREPESKDPIVQQAREIIERQVANLTTLISDLLDVSRVISGRIRLEPQPIELNRVLSHAVETTRPLFDHRKHELVVNKTEDGIWVNADSTRLEEVLVNVLSNAAKYTPDGGRVEVWAEQPKATNLAQIRVRDNGVGIPAELLKNGRIFDLFTQADRSLARSAGGLGIGLSLAHRLVEMHGGSIEAHSPPVGERIGSEFVIRLPLVPAPVEAVNRQESTPAVPATDRRVLVVDDNQDQVTMLAAGLRHFGYSVQVAYSGPEALGVARQWRPDVVVLDIGLPGLDGYEVARRIRSDAALEVRSACLIALTGYGREVDKAVAHEAGFNAHLVKPATLDDIVAVLARCDAR